MSDSKARATSPCLTMASEIAGIAMELTMVLRSAVPTVPLDVGVKQATSGVWAQDALPLLTMAPCLQASCAVVAAHLGPVGFGGTAPAPLRHHSRFRTQAPTEFQLSGRASMAWWLTWATASHSTVQIECAFRRFMPSASPLPLPPLSMPQTLALHWRHRRYADFALFSCGFILAIIYHWLHMHPEGIANAQLLGLPGSAWRGLDILCAQVSSTLGAEPAAYSMFGMCSVLMSVGACLSV